MLTQLVVTVRVIAMDSGRLDDAVHVFDPVSSTGQALAIGPGTFDLGQPVINVVSGAATLECMTPEQLSFFLHRPDVGWRPAAASWINELDAIVSKNSVEGVGNRCNEIVEELL
jgi:hypothetical protein